MSLNWEMPSVFLRIQYTGVMYFGRESTEVKCLFIPSYQGSILWTWTIATDVDHNHLPEVFVMFLHCKITTLNHFPYCILWKNVTMCSQHLRNEKNQRDTPWYWSTYTIWNSSVQKVCLFLPIYLFIYPVHLFESVWSSGHLLFTLRYNSVLFYSFCYSNSSSFGHWEILQLSPKDIWHIPIIFKHFLTFWNYKILQAHLLYFPLQS